MTFFLQMCHLKVNTLLPTVVFKKVEENAYIGCGLSFNIPHKEQVDF